MWELELRDSKTDNWVFWCKGTLEECLADVAEFKAGKYLGAYDAARLTTERH